MKTCNRCKVERPDEDFVSTKRERVTTCIKCRETYKRRYNVIKSGRQTPVVELKIAREIARNKGNFICGTCAKEKPLEEFGNTNSYKGSGYTCAECRRILDRYSKIKRLGISKEEVNKMYEDQNHSCAICNTHIELFGSLKDRPTTMCVDHDHKTGEIRGLLCNSCNRGLGFLGDNPKLVKSAYEYLLAHYKSDKLLGKPEEVNQQPIISLKD